MMSKLLKIIVLVCLTAYGCKQDEMADSSDGFYMTIGEKTVLDQNGIDYYDFSSHLIYLKGNNSLASDKLVRDSFQIWAGGEKIYTGVFHSWVLSSMPKGPAIYTPVLFYPEFVLPVDFVNWNYETPMVDPRNDPRLVQVFKKSGQYHAGLSCVIKSLNVTSDKKLRLELQLSNNDTFNYYYPDPDKMGNSLYHYFTNGLSLRNPVTNQYYFHHIEPANPGSGNQLRMDWMSLINSHETKSLWIVYNNFDDLPPGKYQANFSFTGLSHIDRKDLVQRNGRIWLGSLNMSNEIQIR